MRTKINRIMIAGTNSGCGKTTVTCAVLRALQNKGLGVASFKCGPDYIDPMFHNKVIGTKSRNIDTFLCGEEASHYLFVKNSRECDVSVVEGVMGFYDGIGGNTVHHSSYEISQVLKIPVVLVIDCKGASLSLAAAIKGYLEFLPNHITGVILNNLSAVMYPTYKAFIEKYTKLTVFGYMPKEPMAAIESRHLGLVTAAEISDLNVKIDKLAELAEKSLDLDKLLEAARTAECLEYEKIIVEKLCDVRIAYANDQAFCFYYEDSLDLLRELGATLIPFSPLKDYALPEDIDGMIIGGGYPELYVKELSGNKTMLEGIKKAYENQMPIFAECGGFMYLANEIDGYPMCQVIEMNCRMTDKLQNFGYITLKSANDNLLLDREGEIKAHEFHYSISDLDTFDLSAGKLSGKKWMTGYCRNNLFALYPHLHLYGNLNAAKKIIVKCKEYQNGHKN